MTETNKKNKDTKGSGIFLVLKYGLLTSLFFAFISVVIRFIPIAYSLIYSILSGLCIAKAISCGIRENKYNNRKLLAVLIIICAFFTYLLYSYMVYISYTHIRYVWDPVEGSIPIISFSGFLCETAVYVPLRCYFYDNSSNDYPSIYKFVRLFLGEKFISSISYNTWAKINTIMNLSIWILELVITSLCAWKYLIFICPWLSQQKNNMNNKVIFL
jgi:hypothetical protein